MPGHFLSTHTIKLLRPNFYATTDVNCTHPESEIRRRILKTGSITLYKQCCTCGEPLTSALSKSGYTALQIQSLNPYDEDLRQFYYEQHKVGNSQERQKQSDALMAEKRAKYREYLCSPAWAYRRERVLERDQYKCRACEQARATQVHHLTYDRIFEEPLFDLVAICEPCHKRIHKEYA